MVAPKPTIKALVFSVRRRRSTWLSPVFDHTVSAPRVVKHDSVSASRVMAIACRMHSNSSAVNRCLKVSIFSKEIELSGHLVNHLLLTFSSIGVKVFGLGLIGSVVGVELWVGLA